MTRAMRTILAMLLLGLAGCATVEERAAAKMGYMFPKRQVAPGEVVPFGFWMPPEIRSARVYFLRQFYHLFRQSGNPDANFITYFPVPPDLPAGDHLIDCSFDVVKGRRALREHFTLQVMPPAAVTVRTRTLKRFQWEAFQGEQRRIHKAVAVSAYRTGRLEDFLLPLGGKVQATYITRTRINDQYDVDVHGLEILASNLSPQEVNSMAGGKVVLAKPLPMRGATVVIDHGFSHFSVYSGLGRILAEEGQVVRRGQAIGKAGGSGALFPGRELWFQIYVAGVPVDVQKLMRVEIY